MSLNIFFLFSTLWAFSAPSASSDTLKKVEASWDKTTSFQANFKQLIHSKRMGTKDESTGEVVVQKPGKIRWDIKSERKTQILNGNKLTQIQVPKRRKANVVDIYENVSKQIDVKNLAFLSGTEAFKKSYVMNIAKENEKSVEVKLVATGGSKTDSYIAEFDKSSYLLRSLVTESADSTVRIEFTDIKTNINPDVSTFDYKPGPKDVVNINK